jgi:lipopolysaccharide/colanic/teichoic acid biosynthesis glycosyltransferase
MHNILTRALAGLALLMLSPLLAVCAAAVYLQDRGDILFWQVRVGQQGRPFRMVKFRSMRMRSMGTNITASGDSRITRLGKVLRDYKLDEIPQLWNVAAGHMSIVGPRPEVPQYVDPAEPRWQEVLSVRPGITDLASLVFRNEESLLASHPDPEGFYRASLLPRKLELSAWYLRTRSMRSDATIVALTIIYSFARFDLDPDSIATRFAYKGGL